MAHAVYRFEFADGSAELVAHGSVRYHELLEDGHAPVGEVPGDDGISDDLAAYLNGRLAEGAATDAGVAEIVETGPLTRDVLSATIAAEVASTRNFIADLREPFFLSHRGGILRYPEHSLEGMRASVRDGFGIEVDLRTLGDGTIVPIHDDTLDAATNGTGPITAIGYTDWKALRLDAPARGMANPVPPTWADVLGEFGGRIPLYPEITVTAEAQAIMDTITARGLEKSVIVQCKTLAPLTDVVVPAGGEACFISDTVTDFAALKASGVNYLACFEGMTGRGAYIASAVAAGLKVIVWTVNTRTEADACIAEGASGIISDDPWWVSGWYANRNVDPYREQVPWPDYHPSLSLPSVLAFRAPGEHGRLVGTNAAGAVGLNQAWAGVRPTGKVRIEATVHFLATAENQSSWFSVAFGQWPDDTNFSNSPTVGQKAYHAIIKRSNVMELYRFDSGTGANWLATKTGAVAVAAAGVEGTCRIRLDVTATGVQFTNLTSGEGTTLVADTTHRGPGRVAFLWNGADALVSDVAVVDL